MSKTEKECSKDVTPSCEYAKTRHAAFFSRIPIPPSSNNQYFLARRGKKTYHIPSDELKLFKKNMEAFPYSADQFLINRLKVQQWVRQGSALEISTVFFFKRERLFTLKHAPKKLDCSNRLKALHDSLCHILQIDDSWFFKVHAEKVICPPHLTEQCWVEILPII